MSTYGVCVSSEVEGGVLSFSLDRLGGTEGGGLPLESLHPYGFRSAPHDADVSAEGEVGKGAGLLVCSHGGGDEGAVPLQDPRVEVPDHGKGGCVMYGGPAGGAVSSVMIAGSDGKVRVSAPETIVGEDAGAKTLVISDVLMQWITGTLLPALAANAGTPIIISPPASLATTKLRAQ